MSIFVVIVGILGVLVTLHSLYDGAKYLAGLWRWVSERETIKASTLWVETTAPALSTILLFLLQHWVFSIVILLKVVLLVILGISGEGAKEKMYERWGVLFHYGFGFIDGIIIALGPAIILTLSLTVQSVGGPTLWSWYFPALIVAFVVGEQIGNMIFGVIIATLAGVMAK